MLQAPLLIIAIFLQAIISNGWYDLVHELPTTIMASVLGGVVFLWWFVTVFAARACVGLWEARLLAPTPVQRGRVRVGIEVLDLSFVAVMLLIVTMGIVVVVFRFVLDYPTDEMVSLNGMLATHGPFAIWSMSTVHSLVHIAVSYRFCSKCNQWRQAFEQSRVR